MKDNNKKEKLIIETQQEREIREEREIKALVKQELKNICIPLRYLGFKYWTTAVYIAIKFEKEHPGQYMKTGAIYTTVARKHKSTVSKVERAMRYIYMEQEVKETIKQYFNISHQINNSELLNLLKENVTEKYYSNVYAQK